MNEPGLEILVAGILRAARSATRCRQAAADEAGEVAETLHRAADRYSRHLADLADDLAAAGAPK